MVLPRLVLSANFSLLGPDGFLKLFSYGAFLWFLRRLFAVFLLQLLSDGQCISSSCLFPILPFHPGVAPTAQCRGPPHLVG